MVSTSSIAFSARVMYCSLAC
ncbi:hypothetical protein VCHC47A1_1037, partial [Vibrio cholerae HC-47A1]